MPVHSNPELRQLLKDGTITCLYIICKSFILNVNLIDQATPGGKDKHTHIQTHAHLHVTLQLPSLSAFKPCQTCPPRPPFCCWQREVSGVTAHPEYGQPARHTHKHTHKTEVRPVSTGVWRPAEVPRLCIVLICGRMCVCVCARLCISCCCALAM